MFSSTLLSLLASSTLLVQGLPVTDNTATISRRDSETSTPTISRRGSQVDTTPPISRRGSQVETTPFGKDSEVSLESRNACEADDDPIRGVNLGGWLVLEPWMNWELVGNTGAPDQWTFDQTDNAEAALQSHWGSWFNEADMARIASWGLNTYVLFLIPQDRFFSLSPNTVSLSTPRQRYTTRFKPHSRPLFSPSALHSLSSEHPMTHLFANDMKQCSHTHWLLGLQQHRQPLHLRRRRLPRTSPRLGSSVQHPGPDLHARPAWIPKRFRQLWPQG